MVGQRRGLLALPEEDGSGRIPCPDRKTWHQKIRTQKGGSISALVLREGRKFQTDKNAKTNLQAVPRDH